MGNEPLFGSLRDALPWQQPEQGTFVCGKPGSGMAFHDPRHRFRIPKAAAEVCSGLCMTDGVGAPAPDIVEHGACLKKSPVDKRTAG
jgi:hypothetical protein